LAYLLGIDLGAGSLKATIITETGVVAGNGSYPLTTSVPHFGWSEQDPAAWWAALCAAVPAALATAGIAASAVAGIGVTFILNLGVSFAIASIVALRAYDIPRSEQLKIAGYIVRDFLQSPLTFVVPERIEVLTISQTEAKSPKQAPEKVL